MGRGLSDLQKEIIEAIRRWGDGSPPPTTGDILDMLGRTRTRSNYATTSKALDRLYRRKIVTCSQGDLYRPGKGLGYHLLQTLPK